MTVALPLGRVGFVPRPDYTPGQECFPLDAVNYKNTLWACLARTTDVPGPTNPNWVAMLSLAAGLAPGGGLAVNEDGLLFVAPDGFSESLLTELMGRMRVPIWLSQDTNWYVNPLTGDDGNDGLSAARPFKTAQGAINHVAENYNLGTHYARINLAAETYTEDISLPKYQTSTGRIVILGPSPGNPAIIKGAFYAGSNSGGWHLANLKVSYDGRQSPSSAVYFSVLAWSGSSVTLQNVAIDCGAAGVYERYGAAVIGGSMTIADGCSFSGQGVPCLLYAMSGGWMQLTNDLTANGSVTVGTAYVHSSGSLVFDASTLGRVPFVTGTVSGPRAMAYTNGIIDTGGSGGSAAFPGTTSPEPEAGGRIV